jgi:hypothetical protein
MTFCYELLVALPAHKWPFTSVGTHMCFQVACL